MNGSGNNAGSSACVPQSALRGIRGGSQSQSATVGCYSLQVDHSLLAVSLLFFIVLHCYSIIFAIDWYSFAWPPSKVTCPLQCNVSPFQNFFFPSRFLIDFFAVFAVFVVSGHFSTVDNCEIFFYGHFYLARFGCEMEFQYFLLKFDRHCHAVDTRQVAFNQIEFDLIVYW